MSKVQIQARFEVEIFSMNGLHKSVFEKRLEVD